MPVYQEEGKHVNDEDNNYRGLFGTNIPQMTYQAVLDYPMRVIAPIHKDLWNSCLW